MDCLIGGKCPIIDINQFLIEIFGDFLNKIICAKIELFPGEKKASSCAFSQKRVDLLGHLS